MLTILMAIAGNAELFVRAQSAAEHADNRGGAVVFIGVAILMGLVALLEDA